jgi:MoaA/NifB/PqqE/SkfB family radical SAM enzyme
MFRVSQFMQEVAQPTQLVPKRPPSGPVVIWNLIRRCNLNCKHCYSISADRDFPGELTTQEVYAVMDDLKRFDVPVLILSGGEPLLRSDIFRISHRAKEMGFYVGLSTNGTLINERIIAAVAAVGYDYVGISLDGIGETHDKFRRHDGAYDLSLNAIRLCRQRGIKVGIRFTMTMSNARELPDLIRLAEDEGVDKFYLSHLNYAGRGNTNRADDAQHATTRWAMNLLFDTCWDYVQWGEEREFITGKTSTTSATFIRTPCGGTTTSAACATGRFRRYGPTPRTRSWPASSNGRGGSGAGAATASISISAAATRGCVPCN